jgi:hypothetical protein
MRTTCLCAVTFTCLTTAAQAQHTAAASFAALRATLKTGDTVFVTETSGKVTRGKIGDLSATTLELFVPRRQPDGRSVLITRSLIADSDVTSIQLEHRDSLWNGALIGFGTGAAIGGFLGALACVGDFNCSNGAASQIGGAVLGIGMLGAGIGTLSDALIGHTRTTIYQARQRAAAVDIVPLLGPSRVGAWMSIRF